MINSRSGRKGKRRRQNTKAVWITVGLVLFFSVVVSQGISDILEVQERKQQLIAELPNGSTGHQWVNASDEAKRSLMDRLEGPSIFGHPFASAGVDHHYEDVDNLDDRVGIAIVSWESDNRRRTANTMAAYDEWMDPTWKRDGWHSEEDYEAALELQRMFPNGAGADLNETKAVYEKLRNDGF